MRGRLVVVTGTGTGIGKTHVACALLTAFGVQHRAVGYKPVETGVRGAEGADARALRRAASFHVKPSPRRWAFAPPISPHLAARQAEVRLRGPEIAAEASRLLGRVDVVVLELAGGLFSPLGPDLLNVDLARLLAPTQLLLVAPDRLGALHDVLASTRAARAAGVAIHGILLSAPRRADVSTGTNAPELESLTPVPVLGSLPRAAVGELAHHAAVLRILRQAGRGGRARAGIAARGGRR